MTRLPRIAVGTIQPDVEDPPILWAVLNLLHRHDMSLQTFSSQARFHPRTGVASIAGQNQRHLDSWLMTREVARELFLRGSQTADLSVVEGTWFEGAEGRRAPREGCSVPDPKALEPSSREARGVSEKGRQTLRGGRLETLCEWLDLPRIAIVDARRVCSVHLPARPASLDGILLDAVPAGRAGLELRINLEAVWGVPVLGTLPLCPQLRGLIAALPPTCPPSSELCRALGDALSPCFDARRLLEIAARREFPATSTRLFDKQAGTRRCSVAVAYDEAFHCYFPDTLDLLESWGAKIRDFSPLHGDRIPDDTDVVYLGCGPISPHAEELSANCCMKQALRSFAAGGGRVYAECAGLAYLCEHVVLESGAVYPMSGVFPAVACRNAAAGQPRPVELPFTQACWMGTAPTRLRGYCNDAWQIQPVGPLSSDAGGRFWNCQQVIGSRVHLDFAAQPHLLDRFFHPLRSPLGAIR